jgi:ABC-type uncharacterized transport system ATPase subunit
MLALIEVKNVSKKYGGFYAVRNINFNIKDGEIVGFLGRNGARKNYNYEYDYRFYRTYKRSNYR